MNHSSPNAQIPTTKNGGGQDLCSLAFTRHARTFREPILQPLHPQVPSLPPR